MKIGDQKISQRGSTNSRTKNLVIVVGIMKWGNDDNCSFHYKFIVQIINKECLRLLRTMTTQSTKIRSRLSLSVQRWMISFIVVIFRHHAKHPTKAAAEFCSSSKIISFHFSSFLSLLRLARCLMCSFIFYYNIILFSCSPGYSSETVYSFCLLNWCGKENWEEIVNRILCCFHFSSFFFVFNVQSVFRSPRHHLVMKRWFLKMKFK